MTLLPKRALVGAIALVALGSVGCVKQDPPGVGLVKFDSTAVFGITPDKPSVPGFDLPEGLGLEEPALEPPLSILPKVDDGPCPAAKLTAFPKKAATVQVTDLPPVGVYKWQRDLLTLKSGEKVTSAPFALQNRAIRRVVQDGDHAFNFEMLAPDPFVARNTLITTFRVNTNPQLLVDQRVASRTIGVVDVPGQDVRVINPADAPGIFIVSTEQQASNGARLSQFKPVQPMLIFPLEGGIVRVGQTFRSVGIDSASGSAIVNDGIVGRTSRIDACGEIVEGFAVTLHQTLTSDVDLPDPQGSATKLATRQETREITYTFATQYGALPISETLSIGDIAVDPVAALGKWELGALTPTALPDNLK